MGNEANTSTADPQDETPNGSTPPVETTTTAGTGETPATTTTSSDDTQRQLDELRAALKKANAEAASHRHKANELDRLKAETEAAKLSETEKLQKKLAELQSQHDNVTRQSQERIINYEVRLQAATMGIVDPDAAAKLLDWSAIEYNDDGSPTNIDDLLKKLAKAKPYLVGKPAAPTSGGATNPPRSQSSAPPPLSREAISRMTPDEYNARRAEVQAWLAANPYRFGQRR